jgi:hypothetical protein
MSGGPFWALIIHDEGASENKPTFLFEGSEDQMREFVKSQYKKREGDSMIALKDDDFSKQPRGVSIYDVDVSMHLHIYRYETKVSAHSGGRRRRQSRRRRC